MEIGSFFTKMMITRSFVIFIATSRNCVSQKVGLLSYGERAPSRCYHKLLQIQYTYQVPILTARGAVIVFYSESVRLREISLLTKTKLELDRKAPLLLTWERKFINNVS